MSTLKVDSIGKTSGSTQDTMAGLTKVWLNYNQVNDTTNDTFNVSSILDSSTGVFIATFSNNMNNTTYTASLSSSQAANEATQAQYAVGTRATNSCGYDTENISSVNTDLAQNDSLIHGDLA